MRVSSILIPYVIKAWQQDETVNTDNLPLDEMIERHNRDLTAFDLPMHMVIALEEQAMQLLLKEQAEVGHNRQ